MKKINYSIVLIMMLPLFTCSMHGGPDNPQNWIQRLQNDPHGPRAMLVFAPLLALGPTVNSLTENINVIETTFDRERAIADVDRILYSSAQINVPEDLVLMDQNMKAMFDKVRENLATLKNGLLQAGTSRFNEAKAVRDFLSSVRQLAIQIQCPAVDQDWINRVYQNIEDLVRRLSVLERPLVPPPAFNFTLVPPPADVVINDTEQRLCNNTRAFKHKVHPFWQSFMDFEPNQFVDIGTMLKVYVNAMRNFVTQNQHDMQAILGADQAEAILGIINRAIKALYNAAANILAEDPKTIAQEIINKMSEDLEGYCNTDEYKRMSNEAKTIFVRIRICLTPPCTPHQSRA